MHNLTLLATATDFTHLHYAAQSKIYPFATHKIFVTARGSCGKGDECSAQPPGVRSPGAAVSAYELSDATPFAHLVDAWSGAAAESYAPEGQDAFGDILVVAELLHGHLLSFNASCLSCGVLHALKLSTNSALHVRRHQNFALVSTGLASLHRDTSITGGLLAVRVEADGRMHEAAFTGDSDGIPKGTEGVLVHGDYAYVGGFRDTHLAMVSLAGLDGGEGAARLRVVRRLADPAYVQMVGAALPSSVLAFALWGAVGGLATFRVAGGGAPRDDAPSLTEAGRLALPALAAANRVHVHGDLAWLPLEQEPGAVAAVNVSDAREPSLALSPVALHGRPGSTCYCLAVHGERVYAFAAPSATLFVFAVPSAAGRVDGTRERRHER